MKTLLARLMVVGFVAVLGAGCASPQMMEQAAAVPEKEPGTSLLDLQWVNPAMQFATEATEEQLKSARVEAPAAYTEEQRGRVSLEGATKLPPLPATEMWYPEKLPSPPLDLTTPVRPPLPPLPVFVDISKPPLRENSDS